MNQIVQVIVLLHGIRTDGAWHNRSMPVLEKQLPNTKVLSVKYQCSLLDYLNPLRSMHIKELFEKLEQIDYRDKNGIRVPVSVVAHSYGTYLLAKVLERYHAINVKRVLLCGAVLPRNYDWHRLIQNKRVDALVNDCGMQDIWPVLSKAVALGTGDSGVFGFDSSGDKVKNRRFDYYSHGSFFERSHIEKYWIPFLKDGIVEEGPLPPPEPPSWIQIAKHKWFVRSVFATLVLAIVVTVFYLSLGQGVQDFKTFIAKTFATGDCSNKFKSDHEWTRCYIYSQPLQTKLFFDNGDIYYKGGCVDAPDLTNMGIRLERIKAVRDEVACKLSRPPDMPPLWLSEDHRVYYAATVAFKIEKGIDRFGLDYKSSEVNEQEECEKQCSQDPWCEAFTFAPLGKNPHPPLPDSTSADSNSTTGTPAGSASSNESTGTRNNNCWLKYDIPPPAAEKKKPEEIVSGYKTIFGFLGTSASVSK